jgi:hypothetical protein
MTKLKTEEKYKWGQTNILPIVGEVNISAEGEIEIEDSEKASDLVELGIGFVFCEELSSSEENDLGKEEENDLGKPTSDSEDKVPSTLDVLNEMTLAQLKEAAKDFPSSEWRNITNKKGLVDYLVNKLS